MFQRLCCLALDVAGIKNLKHAHATSRCLRLEYITSDDVDVLDGHLHWLIYGKRGCLCSVQVAFYAATAVVGGYAWASSSGFAPTGRQVIDGFLGDVQALFNNKTILSGLLALLSVAAVAVGSLILNQPLTYFHPSDFR